jgi:hypothetical protein
MLLSVNQTTLYQIPQDPILLLTGRKTSTAALAFVTKISEKQKPTSPSAIQVKNQQKNREIRCNKPT